MAASTESTAGAEKPKVEAPAAKAENKSSLPEDARPPGDLRRRTKKDKREGPFVKYVGAAAVRSISPAEWKSLGVELKEDAGATSWNVGNDKLVEMDKFSDGQLDYLLIDDLQQGTGAHAFLLVDYDDNGQLVQAVYE